MSRRVAIALLVVATAAGLACKSAPPPAPPLSPEVAALQARAQGVTITRDDWGIPHITAKTDADAVFGLMYAQAEDDFNRVETNFINAMGRLAEAEGEKEIYRDLRMKLFIDPVELRAQYEKAPAWLQALMSGWADGLNYYLATHPNVAPRVITKFEPWMALSFSEGSIGGDIESISIARLEAFYGRNPAAMARVEPDPLYAPVPPEPTGSNGFAVAPKNTTDGKALLFINPHTSFFFREEAHVTSDEGLNAYGALTWGQFFIYQGFNERAGWMHTSSGVDNIDEFLLTTVTRDGQLFYKYGDAERQVQTKTITVPYKTPGGMAEKTFTVYRTHHGPVVREEGGRMVAVQLMEEPLKALIQSYSRTKARSLAEYKQVMEAHTNSSNNTLYADADGNIAYFHSNFVPKRNPRLDWSRPVDGSVPANDWQGIHTYAESPNVENPASGWVYNTNNWPYSAAGPGPDSPRQRDYAPYFDRVGENPRGVHAIRVMKDRKDFTLDSLTAAIFDSQQPEFEVQVPLVVRAWDQAPASHPLKTRLKDPIERLRAWDHRWGVDSVPQTLAWFWGEEMWSRSAEAARGAGVTVYEYLRTRATPEQRLEALAAAVDKIAADFGQWATPWGEVNRFQRISPAIVHPFDDSKPSTPVGFASARWGSLASFGARSYNGSKKIYGTSGNSFVASVEFGKDGVRAKAVTAGGLSSDVTSPHFNDQAERYATGNLREVYFYPRQLEGHTERTYKPGQ
ncbi:MAG: penicillin acylase family protein [Vicinamibacterales bacterium]